MDKFFDMPVVVDLLAFYLDSAIDIFPNYHKWSAWSALFLFYFQLLIITFGAAVRSMRADFCHFLFFFELF